MASKWQEYLVQRCTRSNQPERGNWGATRVPQNDKQYRNDGCFPSERVRLSNRARNKLKTKQEEGFS